MKACTIAEAIIVLAIIGLILIYLFGYYPTYHKIWYKYPECRYAQDPMTCAVILERK